jgi:hypothetical protein
MGKPPAFMFHIRDWLSDPQPRQASPMARGMINSFFRGCRFASIKYLEEGSRNG